MKDLTFFRNSLQSEIMEDFSMNKYLFFTLLGYSLALYPMKRDGHEFSLPHVKQIKSEQKQISAPTLDTISPELKAHIVSFLVTAGGATNIAKLYAAVHNIKKMMFLNKGFCPLSGDIPLNKMLIEHLALLYTGGDKVAACLALATHGAGQWLLSTMDQDPMIEKAADVFQSACKIGDEGQINFLIHYGAPEIINMADATGDTPLIFAADKGYLKIVSKLLLMGANLNIQNDHGNTALMAAAAGGYGKIVEILINPAANINLQNVTGHTALMFAVQGGHIPVVLSLIKAQALLELRSTDNKTALLHATEADHDRIVQALIEAGANVHCADNNFYTPLIIAAYSGNGQMVKMLLKAGALVDARDQDQNTALIHAADQGKEEIVKMLLFDKADINLINVNSETALMFVCSQDEEQLAIVKTLLRAGAKIELKDGAGETALHRAVQAHHEKIVRELVKKDKKIIDMQNNDGQTALMIAVQEEIINIIVALLEADARVDLKDADDHTALNLIEQSDSVTKNEIIELLKKYGA